ncbi:rod shape-determining protein MreD [Stutzerimonas kirkiae]|uniref:rod shape-determining protein MreD n=1 Tax=Stutzerimonas kirkiae TaxID=2211392 RepID=UPI001038535D|nr:rod shape-determining protein MreD [Stutzerimonas kirkiae]TBV10757.1 rod shape-determining protein MreD [Stutzerimonas kirkiae]
MIQEASRNVWVIWLSWILALMLSIAPMPEGMVLGRPLWLGLVIAYWALVLPQRGGMTVAFCLGLALDVLSGTLLGQSGLPLVLIVFLVLSLQQRLRMFPLWQQSMVLLVIFGVAQLVQLWLRTLTGNHPPTLLFLVPVPISALLWPWIYIALEGVRRRFHVN